jgi:hypothetical protein
LEVGLPVALYKPKRIADGIPPYAVALAEIGRAGRLAIYAGAGLSLAEPAGLPTGPMVAKRLYERLQGAFPQIEDVDPEDLTAVADAVAALESGEDALRFTVVEVAEFTSAVPTYGHQVLALLVLEGVVDVLTTNWDDCVERGGGSERVMSIVTEYDLRNVSPRAVLKIHGCATQPSSLLITSSHLDAPPTWVADQTRARLGASVVVFVGIGDVAGYVKKRLEEAIQDVGNVDNVRVVAPGIVDAWDGSQWSQLAPGLSESHRIAETADAFLDHLAAAYVHVTLATASAGLQSAPVFAAAFNAAASGLGQHNAATVLEWVRHVGVVARPGSPVLSADSLTEALTALGKLAGADIRITRDRTVEYRDGQLEVLAAVGPQSAARLRREAQNRLELHLGNGVEPRFLVAGGIGWGPAEGFTTVDVMGDGSDSDVLDGPLNVLPDIVRVEQVLTA